MAFMVILVIVLIIVTVNNSYITQELFCKKNNMNYSYPIGCIEGEVIHEIRNIGFWKEEYKFVDNSLGEKK